MILNVVRWFGFTEEVISMLFECSAYEIFLIAPMGCVSVHYQHAVLFPKILKQMQQNDRNWNKVSI